MSVTSFPDPFIQSGMGQEDGNREQIDLWATRCVRQRRGRTRRRWL
jgi:hypothetical protein